MESSPARPRYAPSGRIDPRRLPIALALWCLTAVVLAAVLQSALDFGHMAILFAVVPTMTAILLMRMCVREGNLRSQWLACVLGAMAALAGQALHFHVDQCLRWNVSWSRVDLLPGYVGFRLATDGWAPGREGLPIIVVLPPAALPPAVRVAPQAPLAAALISWNALHLAYEALVSAALAGACAWRFAGAPFSERRNCWMRKERRFLWSHDAQSLLLALQEKTIEDWSGDVAHRPLGGQPRTELVAWFTPAAAGGDIDSDVYLRIGGQGPYVLQPQEAAALVHCFPGIQEIAGPAKQRLADEARRSADPASARIDPIPVQWAGKGLPRNLAGIIQEGVHVGTFLLPYAIFVVTMVTGLLLGHLIDKGILPQAANGAVFIFMAAGVLMFVWSESYFGHDDRGYGVKARAWFEMACLRRALTVRPDPLVVMDAAATIPVVWLGREYSHRSVRQGAYNPGLLRVDNVRGLILYEGDREQVRIPRAAILKVDLESTRRNFLSLRTVHAVVILARLGSGIWEFPFIPLGHTSQSRRAAARLLREIEALRQPEEIHTREEAHA